MTLTVEYDESIDPEWRPVQGGFFDAVVAALDAAGIPARVTPDDQPDPFEEP
jgi:hypothetical protein